MTNTTRPLPYADGIEIIPADEADDIQRVVQAYLACEARAADESFICLPRSEPYNININGLGDRTCNWLAPRIEVVGRLDKRQPRLCREGQLTSKPACADASGRSHTSVFLFCMRRAEASLVFAQRRE
jgi:hypothetical protein